MKLGKYYPIESEMYAAMSYLGKYALDRKKNYVNRDYLKGYRIVVKMEYDKRCLHYWTDSDSISEYTELYLLAVNSKEEVKQFMKDHILNMKEILPCEETYGGAFSKFGGEPIIDKVCEGRYTLRFKWEYDV
ncbi:MAG: hypothetical protein JEZ08_22510 [Clostridiales bacterium]|nr:hypothetical protein [Clostridiales bacterium]